MTFYIFLWESCFPTLCPHSLGGNETNLDLWNGDLIQTWLVRELYPPGYSCFRNNPVIPTGQGEEYLQLFVMLSGKRFSSFTEVVNLVKYNPEAILPPHSKSLPENKATTGERRAIKEKRKEYDSQ